jgi:hypothetical protein
MSPVEDNKNDRLCSPFFPLFWGLYPIADSIELSSMRKKAAVPWHKLPEKLPSAS